MRYAAIESNSAGCRRWPGLRCAALARRFKALGASICHAAARSKEKLEGLAQLTGARAFGCDASQPAAVSKLFADVEQQLGTPDVVIYNPSGRVRGSFVDLDPIEVERSLAVTAFGGFLVSQAAAQRMVPRGKGVILLTGASAGASRATRTRPRSRWANSRCAGWLKVWRVNSRRLESMSPMSLSTAPSALLDQRLTRQNLIPSSSRTPSRKLTSISPSSPGAPGPGRLEVRPSGRALEPE